jgi:hypothetical protein
MRDDIRPIRTPTSRADDRFDAIAGTIGCVMVLLSLTMSGFLLWLLYKLVMWITAQEL